MHQIDASVRAEGGRAVAIGFGWTALILSVAICGATFFRDRSYERDLEALVIQNQHALGTTEQSLRDRLGEIRSLRSEIGALRSQVVALRQSSAAAQADAESWRRRAARP